MVKDKDRSVNPALAQRKSEKQKALKKSRTEAQARRNEKLARRNPDRLQRQIDDLKSTEESGQQLRPHDKQRLAELEKDLAAVKKAREALGDKAPQFGGSGGGPRHKRDGQDGVLGKRRRDGGSGHWGKREDSSDTDESARGIPMPRDTPPPIPRKKREPRTTDTKPQSQSETEGGPHPLPPKPEPKAVYESAPIIRDLRKEAVSKFVPTAVRQKQNAAKGDGKLVEPEEMDRLEKQGYVSGQKDPSTTASNSAESKDINPESKPSTEIDTNALAEEEERFNRELRSVQVEEVEDEEL